MAQRADSFKQFNYALRPSKQVERKIMVEVLLRLSKAGFSVSEYQYLGFGSPYYVDFVLFHKYLFIQHMTCIEWSDIPKRMRFNKPFKFIKLKLGALSKYIPGLDPTQKYLMWLDYDRSLDPEILKDVDGCLTRLSPRSILVLTIDARPSLPRDQFSEVEDLPLKEREELVQRVYQEWFRSYIERDIRRDTVSPSAVAPLFYEVLAERIRQTLRRRVGDLRFLQIFNYSYRDGAPMLTVGGIIGTAQDEEALRNAGICDHDFVRTNSQCLEISVPPLTIREKYWLDSRLDKGLSQAKLQFELEQELLENYRRFYKEYPTYLETLL